MNGRTLCDVIRVPLPPDSGSPKSSRRVLESSRRVYRSSSSRRTLGIVMFRAPLAQRRTASCSVAQTASPDQSAPSPMPPRTFEGLRCIRARRSSRAGLHCTLYGASGLLCTDSVWRRNRVRSASQHSVASVSQQKFAERVQTANSLSESLQHTRACSPRKTSR